MKKKGLFGFVIDNDIQFDIANKRLTRVTAAISERSMIIGAVSLNEAMVRFLSCLLIRASDGEPTVSKREILTEVWENHNLVSSNQQLWKTVRELRFKLTSIGLHQDFIINVGGKGYSLSNHDITPLFYY
jgi:DNA-binding winged helix-turn-helix (wHTH) protein